MERITPQKIKVFEGVLVLLSPLHVGTGRPTGAIDNPTLKIPILVEGGIKETVVIPASTLKGVIRSAFERAAMDRGESVCNVFNSECEKKGKAEEMCIACRTFGNQKFASRVKFADALPVSDFKTFELFGVALGRESSAVMGGPFSVEAITPGTNLKFQMVVDLPKQSKEFEILMKIIERMKKGELQFGGKKSTGMGRLKLEELTCR